MSIHTNNIDDFVGWLSRESFATKVYFVRHFIMSIDNPTEFNHLEELMKNQFIISRGTLEKSIEEKYEELHKRDEL